MRIFVVGLLAAAAAAVVVVSAGGADPSRPRIASSTAGCGGQAGAVDASAFANRRNIAAGPLVIEDGQRKVPAATIRKFGGDKYLLAVRVGHQVRLELSRRASRVASLYFKRGGGILTRTEVEDGERSVTFRACRGKSRLDDAEVPAGIWIGFVVVSRPMCLRIKVWVDDATQPVRKRLPLGRGC